MLEPLVRAALSRISAAPAVSHDAIATATETARVRLTAREAGVVAGLDLALMAFRLIEPRIEAAVERPDGSRLASGDVIATLAGPARGLLTAERTALNFLCHLSGVATATASVVEAVRGTKASICCTRKTLPGLRALQKYAVRAGGGSNHRIGLDDEVLIKDNHVAIAGGIRPRSNVSFAVGHMVKVELEVDTLAQLEEALTLDVDAVLLDNMAPPLLARPWRWSAAAS